MMLLLPVTVKAVEGVSAGEFTVSGDAGSYSYDADAHTLTITGGEALTISGNAVADHIVVGSGVTANLTLEGENTLKSGYGCAGLRASGKLIITKDSTGSLTATGGKEGAGIGGGDLGAGENITITGGTVNATAGDRAAGIGGGNCKAGGKIIINGGKITVTSDGGVGAIGYGYGGSNAGTTDFSTTYYDENNNAVIGSAVIFCYVKYKYPAILDSSTEDDSWNGVVLYQNDSNKTGEVYGDFSGSFDIPQYYKVTIPEGASLTIPENGTVTNDGTILNYGIINIDENGTLENSGGTITNSGTITSSTDAKIGGSVKCKLNVKNAAVSIGEEV